MRASIRIYEGENQIIGLIFCSVRNESVMPHISETLVGLGTKNLGTPGDEKGEGPMLDTLNQTLPGEIVRVYRRGRL